MSRGKQSKLRDPSLKEKRFVAEYLKTGSKTKAGLKAYDTDKPKNASVIGHYVLKRPHVINYMERLLEEEGVSDSKIAKKLNDIIDAGTTQSMLKSATPTNALEALKFSAKLKDRLPAERKEINQQTAQLNLDVRGASEEDLQAKLDAVLGEIRDFKKVMNETKQLKGA